MRAWLTCVLVGAMGCAGSPTTTGTPWSPAPDVAIHTSSGSEELDARSDLEALLAFATRRHPKLAAEHARWRAHRAQAAGEGPWPDPKVGYTFAPLPIETRLGPMRHTFTASQTIPWFSERALAQDAQGAKARAAARHVDARYVSVRLEVEQLYWSIWSSQQQARILERELELLETLEQGVKARVEIGDRPASELARLALERVQLADRARALTAHAQASSAALGRALGLQTAHTPSFPDTLARTTQPPPRALEATLADAPTPPQLLALTEEIAARELARELAHTEQMPRFELGAQWSLIDEGDAGHPDAGRDAVMMRIGVSLPIDTSSTSARIDAAEARVVEAQAELEHARQVWLASMRVAHVRAWEAHRRVLLIEGTLLAQAQAAFELVRGDYEVGRADFTALLATVEQRFALEVELVRERAARELHVSQWHALQGRPLTEGAP